MKNHIKKALHFAVICFVLMAALLPLNIQAVKPLSKEAGTKESGSANTFSAEVLDAGSQITAILSLDIPFIDTGFKAYMDYHAITDKSSVQYQLQQQAYTDENGFRKIDNCYMVAVGSFYAGQCGERLIITLDSGQKFTVIVGDFKADRHTDANNQYCVANHSVLEFIVDTANMNDTAKFMGDMSYAGMQGQIASIVKFV